MTSATSVAESASTMLPPGSEAYSMLASGRVNVLLLHRHAWPAVGSNALVPITMPPAMAAITQSYECYRKVCKEG